MSQEQFLQDACEAAKLGGAELLSRFQQNTEAQFKDDFHDVAAGVVIVQEAGGRVSDGEGSVWTPESKMIVVSNGVIHDEIVARLLVE